MLNRHNMRPSHLHMMVEAPGFKKLVTQFYPEGDAWASSDAAFGVRKSLIVQLKDVDDEEEVRKRGFPKGSSFKLLHRDIIMVSDEESRVAREKGAEERANALKAKSQ